MKTVSIVTIILFFSLAGFSQSFDPSKINQNKLEALILQKLNAHRKTLKLVLLKNQLALQKAASFHSKYQSDNNVLTHDQKDVKNRTPYKRVMNQGGTNGLIGENVAYVSPESTYEDLAEAFYQSWKNSPPHYENMIHPDYRYSGIRFERSKSGKVIYGTHVFGGERYIPPPVADYPVDARGIKDYDEKTYYRDGIWGRSAASFAYSLFQRGDSIFLYYENDEAVEKSILRENDGLAVDIIERRQFPCGSPNLFHGSAIHDGVMLPPVFRDELFQKNKSLHYWGHKLFLGIVPKGIASQIDLAMIGIKDSCYCDYGHSIEIPEAGLAQFRINPIWALGELKQRKYVDTLPPLKNDNRWTRVDSTSKFQISNKVFEIHFDKNRYQLTQLPASLITFLKKNKSEIKSIEVEAFSSVEGATDKNIFLQNKRAQQIENALQKESIDLDQISKTSQENWNLFYAQIGTTKWSSWKSKPKYQIKNALRNASKAKELEPLLKEQRTAKVKITFNQTITTKRYATNYFDQVKTDEELKYLIAYFSQLVAKSKTDSALLVQYQLIQEFLKEKISIHDLTDVNIPIKKENLPLLSNQFAIDLFFRKRIPENKEYIERLKQVKALDEHYLPMKFNFYGYATRYLYAKQEAIGDLIDLEYDILDLLTDDSYTITYQDPKKAVERLQVNFHLGAFRYFRKNKQYDLKGESLAFIRDYFLEEGLTELETLRLALYFNKNGRHEWTLELLWPYIEKGHYMEETLFTYIQTLAPETDDSEVSKKRFVRYGKVAEQRNNDRFCKWLDEEFQLLRTHEIKQIYCEHCE
ncbi:MAG: CAP domain-containing protein [Bacteroidota bacterium]